MAGTMMVREAAIGICRRFVTVAGRMIGEIVPGVAAARRLYGVRHAGPADQDQHQAGKERQQRAHRSAPITPPVRCNPIRVETSLLCACLSTCDRGVSGHAMTQSEKMVGASKARSRPDQRSQDEGTPHDKRSLRACGLTREASYMTYAIATHSHMQAIFYSTNVCLTFRGCRILHACRAAVAPRYVAGRLLRLQKKSRPKGRRYEVGRGYLKGKADMQAEGRCAKRYKRNGSSNFRIESICAKNRQECFRRHLLPLHSDAWQPQKGRLGFCKRSQTYWELDRTCLTSTRLRTSPLSPCNC